MKKGQSVATSLVFLLIIGGFTIASLLKPDRYFSESEKRYLARKPEFSAKTLFSGEYAKDYEEYITDQFVFRDGFISLKTSVERLAGKKDINGVYLAKDDYLIEVHPDSEIDAEKSAKNADRLVQFVENAAESEGIQSVSVMIVPTAVITYQSKLPAFATTWDQNGYIDGIAKRIGPHFIDVRQELQNHAQEYIYYRTDHHWTTYGAYLAYAYWMRQLGEEPLDGKEFNIRAVEDNFLGTIYSKLNYAPRADVIEVYEAPQDYSYEVIYNQGADVQYTLYDEAALETKDQYTFFLKGNNPLVEINSNVQNGRTLLIIKDSYAHCFAPFAANHYEKVVMIDLRYLKKPVASIMEEYGVTDILVLYNAVHFATDSNLTLLK